MAGSWNNRAVIIWFSGLSGAGKTTLANRIVNLSKASGRSVISLDGDVLRQGISRFLGFSHADREENIRIAAEIALMAHRQGVSSVCSFITPTKRMRDILKDILEDKWIHIFLDCSLEECKRRDVKGLYHLAEKGDVQLMTGVTSSFEPPIDADLVVKTDDLSENESVREIREFLSKKHNIFFM